MEKHDPKRRTLLLGTFTVGAALALSACKGKQDGKASGGTEPAPEAAPGTAPQNQTRAVDEAPPSKMSKEGAQYQDKPQDGRKCADCTNFIAASKTCKVVEGEVSPQGWCIFWAQA